MSDIVTPDFGFDENDPIVDKEARDPWSYMLCITGSKQK
jgi:hypothetical protein